MTSPAVPLDGRVAIITGAGSGIGRALANAFAAAGARVVIGDINAIAANETAQFIRGRGQSAVAQQADASTAIDIRALIALANREFGPVDVYVANAGVAGSPGLGIDESDWDRAIAVNLSAHIRAATLLVPGWIERRNGYFVSIASAAGLLTQIGGASYAVTKHAAVGFAEWLAIEYGDMGVGVSCVCPLGVNTPLLKSTLLAPDDTERLIGDAIVAAGEVIEPEQVASVTVDAVRNGRFMVLPHPHVLGMYQQKSLDYDRWIAGMRRYRASLTARHDPNLSR
jgi:NAD(P)-dependent dehydrogenase (short-subunit alcohol dehydrogenase family)